jgi:ribonucleoside-diphosphate reductase alpha chain
LDAYEHVARLFTVVLDISVSMASFPAEEFALGAWNYRTLGLGYADLGGLLMRLALPYDSDEGRALAAALTALMTAVAYRTSAEMAAELGPFPRWEANQIPFRVVMQKHREAVRNIGTSTDQVGEIVIRAQERWNHVQMSAPSFRNAQTTLIAPTGTISFVLDCDTSGCEPDYALVKTKQLAGGRGAAMRIVNQAVPAALRQLGYDDSDIIDAEEWIKTRHELSGWPRLHPKYEHKHLKVFQCVAELRPMAHVEMLAAIQPFLSGAASKTVNLPNGATVEDVSTIYREAWRRGVKAIALYRDGSKLTQPLAAAKREIVDTSDTPEVGEEWFKKARRVEPKNPVVIEELRRGERESLPPRRRGETQKARVGGQTVYWRTGEYPDGRLGEVFIDLAGAGSTLDGFANSLAKIASIALQFGAPPEKVVDALLGVRFEPSGHVELHDRVKWCASIVDLVARDLGIAYCGREDLANVVAAVAVDSQREVVALDRRAIAVAAGVPTGERCGHCGGPLVQTGTCRTCGDCGRSEGGCG